MKLVGAGVQQRHDYMYDASGSITAGGTAQLVLAQSPARSLLFVQNQSNATLWIDIGSARATATVSAGTVTGCTITNAGFNFTRPPVVMFMGGGRGPNNNTSFLGGNQPNYPSPPDNATGHAVLSGSTVGSIVIDHGGSGYQCAPYVFMYNSDLDPYGCAIPSAGVGIELVAGQSIVFNATCCPTDPVAIFGASTSLTFCCKWMD
jgi:hypothetical protein